MKMNTFTKCSCIFSIAFSMTFATEIDYKQLEVHANECLDYLSALTNPEYSPKTSIQKSYENGNLILRYKDEVISQTDKIAEKWIQDCNDIFVSDKYAPGFFRDSPILKVVKDRIERQKTFSWQESNQIASSKSKNEDGPFKLRATFQNGFLRDLEVITPYTTQFQYNYGGENLIWGFFDDENVLSSGLFKGSFTYTFSKLGDSLQYTSPFKNYTTENNGKGHWGTRISTPKTWEQKSASQDVLNGGFAYEKDLFVAVPRGNIDHSWAIKMSASLGLHAFIYTDDIIKDNNWIKDSTAYMGGVGTLGFLIDVSVGVAHCSPTSGSCYGFGTGYARNAYDGYVIDVENSWYHEKAKSKLKYIDNIKLYAEYYLDGKTPKGFRESINIPLNAKMKYITSKTGFFIEPTWQRFEVGLEVSPIQYIPGIYLQYGATFSTPALW